MELSMAAVLTARRQRIRYFWGLRVAEYFFLFLVLHNDVASTQIWTFYDEEYAMRRLDSYYNKLSQHCRNSQLADWAYETNITEENEKASIEAAQQLYNFKKNEWKTYFSQVYYYLFSDTQLSNILKSLDERGALLYGDDNFKKIIKEHSSTLTKMKNIYSTAEYPCTSSETEVNQDACDSQGYDQLLYHWEAWRKSIDPSMRSLYEKYVDLSNIIAQHWGYADHGEKGRSYYDSVSLKDEVLSLWDTIEPLYVEIHKFVQRRLKKYYGGRLDISDGLLPEHFISEYKNDRFDLIKPFPEIEMMNITKSFIEQDYDVQKMFKLADDFYVSMGLANNSVSYGENAMLVRPTDRDVVCHPTAWNFCDNQDFRIKMCTEINIEDYYTILHEMGHIQYFIQYGNQASKYRNAPNEGFQEAIGDTLALSARTPSYLLEVRLLKEYQDSYKNDINFLMALATEKVFSLPHFLIMELWKWDVFSGNVSVNKWNEHWWYLKKKYERSKPPVPIEESDFEPGALYYIVHDEQTINYFIANILQFQFHEALCNLDTYKNFFQERSELHKCSIYRSRSAGNRLRDGMMLGSSVHWRDVLSVITGMRDYSSRPLLEYFLPLYQFLLIENLKADKEEVNIFINFIQSFKFVIVLILCLMCLIVYVYLRMCYYTSSSS